MVKIINKKNVTDTKSLKNRIDFNKKYSRYNFDEWIERFYNFRKSGSILDIGCGDGKQINFAIKGIGKKPNIVGVDLSTTSLEKIASKHKKIKNLKLINSNMDNIAKIEKVIKNKKFNLIHSTYSIYYSTNPLKLIKYLKSKLNKNSRLIITIPGDLNTIKKILKIKEDNKKIKKDELENFFNKNFDKVQVNFLNNYLKVNNIDDLINFYTSSAIYEKNKLKYFIDYVKKKILHNGYFQYNKSSIMFIGYN